MQGVEPTGKLDKATYDALKKEKGNKIIRVKEENERAEKKKKELAINTNNKPKKATEDKNQDTIDADDVLDGIQTVIDVIGFVPGVGDIADGVNVGISVVRKDWLGAVFSGIALIPAVGSVIATPMKAISKASKVGKVGKFSKVVMDAIEFLVKFLGGATKVIKKLSGYLDNLKGILRKIPELIKSAAEIKLVKTLGGNKVIQKIISFAKSVRNGIDTICKKADEIFTSVKNAIFPEVSVKKAVATETPVNKAVTPEMQVKNAADTGVSKVDDVKWNNYFKEIESITDTPISKRQRDLIQQQLAKNPHDIKLTGQAYKDQRKAFNNVKDELINTWEKETGQTWPTHSKDILDKNGNVYIRAGTKFDAHEIIPNVYNSPLEWWNIHPAMRPTQHQGGIHASGSAFKQIFD